MVKKWIAVTVKERKLKSQIISYSEMAGQFELQCDITALEEARKWLEKPECKRIIIEKEEITK